MPNTTDNQNDISTSGIFTQDETILTDKGIFYFLFIKKKF
jgi:hypothetical protein